MYFHKECRWMVLIYCSKVVLSSSLCFDLSLREQLEDKRAKNFLLGSTVMSKSAVECAALCVFNWKCASFFFKKSDNACRQHRRKMHAMKYILDEGWIGYDFQGRQTEAWMVRDDYTCNEEADVCYKIHTVEESWASARAVCHSEDAELISLNTGAKKTFIENIALEYPDNPDFFIGIAFNDTTGAWNWVTDYSTVKWITEPGDIENCFKMEESEDDIEYNVEGCDGEEMFICEALN